MRLKYIFLQNYIFKINTKPIIKICIKGDLQ